MRYKPEFVTAKLPLAYFACLLLTAAGAANMAAVAQAQVAAAQARTGAPDFGPNVVIFDPTIPAATVQSTLASLANEDQFSANRHAVFFKPGAYNVQAPVGYYESIAGLGETPGAVTINGFLTPNFGAFSFANQGASNYPGANITDTFWRSMENLTVNPVTDTAQDAPPNTLQWGVSQGAPLRRIQVNGDLELTDSFCGNASGGFMADIVVTGNVNPCSQQQWFTRNSTLGSWNGALWNMVFSGVEGAPAPSYPKPPYTELLTTPVSREKPFLYIDVNGSYKVFAPSVQRNSRGTTWATGSQPGRSISISDFFIAKPANTAQRINAALDSGKNLILTPGVYRLDRSLNIKRANTVVLGIGYATLVPQKGTAALTVEDVPGVQIAGLIVDAGPVNSSVLLQLGSLRGAKSGVAADPTTLSDIVFRIGGATLGRATTSLEVNQNDAILDNIWAWRADHGQNSADVGWTVNTAAHGLVVNGNHVTATGLAVEHYQQEQVLWNGNGGKTIFYQSELPYDPPSQAAWMDGTANGYPSYVVADSVKSHQAYGLGIYSYFDQNIDIVEDNAMTVPITQDVAIQGVGTVFLNGSGSITHVINGVGAAVNKGFADQLSPVIAYP